MEQQQSPVKWLAEEFDKIEKEFNNDSIEYSDAKTRAIIIADFMFEEQIKEAHKNGQFRLQTGEQYFKETFNTE